MSKTPFMPLWVSDFLGDTLDLDASEIGAYMLLLMAQWNRDGNSLPNDQKKLQRIARCGRNWAKVWGNINRYFDVDANGVFSSRLRLEAQNVASKREVNARNGALGGKAKSLNLNDVPIANATETLQRNLSIPEPEPYKEKRDTSVSLKKRASLSVNVDADVIQILSISISSNVATSFVKHRRDLKKPMTENAANAMLKKLEGHQDPDAVLTDSIANGWQGIFPEKTKGRNNGQINSNYSTQRDQAFADEILAAARAR
tara:strand:+ start:916 stop:1689 length:774 start_codon:yes stop_codon:yes gene_type:complete